MNQPNTSLLFRFFISQLYNLTRGDWATQVLKYISDINLNIQLQDIQKYSAIKFKDIVKEKVKLYSFTQLLENKK